MQTYSGEYKRKLTTPADAAALIKNGDTLIHGMTVAEPPALLLAVADRVMAGDLKDIKVYSFNPQKYVAETLCRPGLCDVIEAYSWFVSGDSRGLVNVGLTQYVPVYFHQVPRLIREEMTVGVTITTVSPMDQSGFFSLGTCNDYTSVAAKLSRSLIVEVNEHMPRVFGSGMIHISDVDAIVENHVPLMEIPPPPPRPEDALIGKHIAEIIPDGAVLQLGIGGVPNAVTPYLSGHKDLGIHSELFGPGMADLIEKGVITGRRKNLHPDKHVFTCAYGTKHTYDFMNNNPSMESYPSSYVLDPAVICKNDNMISINAILEVDLFGQCNAESLDRSQFSGVGGQLDFVRGANNSKGGKSILAYYSTAKNGQISRIVPRLKEGTMVTTPRMDTNYLCTEYGLVKIKGKSIRARALAIISIAHPRFRDDLLREAENMLLM
ncbi:MAG: acetyl-CoA hydrolase/transferase C-terminal domain-containing protein [Thermodesulfobacteriota bacterium]|nr:acetyl-CoA hydrolase/transferase C-terminal domain-containing protein [Thermodesulfobacteriota bacterium]